MQIQHPALSHRGSQAQLLAQACGTILDTPFLAIELMRTAVREGPPLTLDQEADALEALQQLHAAGILHGDVHARNLLLPCSSSSNSRQPQDLRPRWADFGASSYSRCCQDHAYELKECSFPRLYLSNVQTFACKPEATAARGTQSKQLSWSVCPQPLTACTLQMASPACEKGASQAPASATSDDTSQPGLQVQRPQARCRRR